MIQPTFVSDEQLSMTGTHKGCWISTSDKDGCVVLPAMNATGFSQFSFSLLQGNGNISLSFK